MKYKYRKHRWLDEKTRAIFFGIQAKELGKRGPWMHCTEGPKLLIFAEESACDAKIKKLRRNEDGADAMATKRPLKKGGAA